MFFHVQCICLFSNVQILIFPLLQVSLRKQTWSICVSTKEKFPIWKNFETYSIEIYRETASLHLSGDKIGFLNVRLAFIQSWIVFLWHSSRKGCRDWFKVWVIIINIYCTSPSSSQSFNFNALVTLTVVHWVVGATRKSSPDCLFRLLLLHKVFQ